MIKKKNNYNIREYLSEALAFLMEVCWWALLLGQKNRNNNEMIEQFGSYDDKNYTT